MIGGALNVVCLRSHGCASAFTRIGRKKKMSEVTSPIRIVGRIIKVSKAGWGFISSKDIQFTRIFFHWTSLKQDTLPFLELRTGMIVEFTPIQIEGKGYRAIHVRVIEKPKVEKENADVSTLPEPANAGTGNN